MIQTHTILSVIKRFTSADLFRDYQYDSHDRANCRNLIGHWSKVYRVELHVEHEAAWY